VPSLGVKLPFVSDFVAPPVLILGSEESSPPPQAARNAALDNPATPIAIARLRVMSRFIIS
jgi:hypothetical protein